MELHNTQIGILNKLLFSIESKYSDLKIEPNMENNTFQFHLDKVIQNGLVLKNINGKYSLTKAGKKIANHINTESNTLVERRKISVHLYCVKEINSKLQTLMYTRTKHPFFGSQGFPAGKVLLGENFTEAARRELKEETNLEGTPILFNIVHYLVKDKETKELLDDKLFLDFFIKKPMGDLVNSNEGKYQWIPINDIREHIKKPFNTIQTYQTALERIINFSGNINFEEFEQFTDDF